jgi:hypothetical protein
MDEDNLWNEVKSLERAVYVLLQRVKAHLPPEDPLCVVLTDAWRTTQALLEPYPPAPTGWQELCLALRHLQTAKAAYEGQPATLRRKLLNGWPLGGRAPDGEEVIAKLRGAPVARVLKISLSSAGETQGIEFVPHPRRADVTVQILEGTTKEEAVAQLRKVLERLDQDWNSLLQAGGEARRGPPARKV